MPGIGFTRLESRRERVGKGAPPSLAAFERGRPHPADVAVEGPPGGYPGGERLPPHPGAGVSFFVGPLSSSEREDRVLDVPDVLHHGYPEVVALPAARGEPEVDDREPGERKQHRHRDGVGEEAGGGAAGEDGDSSGTAEAVSAAVASGDGVTSAISMLPGRKVVSSLPLVRISESPSSAKGMAVPLSVMTPCVPALSSR